MLKINTRGILQHLPASVHLKVVSVHLKVIRVISNDTHQGFNPDKTCNCTTGKCVRGLSYIINYNYCAILRTIKQQKGEEEEKEEEGEREGEGINIPPIKKLLLSFFLDLLQPLPISFWNCQVRHNFHTIKLVAF